MPFNLENEMIPIIKSNIKALFDNVPTTMAYAEELPVNHRIVDLAFASMNQDYVKIVDNLALRRAFKKLNMMQLDVLSIFFSTADKVSIQMLSKLLRIRSEKVKSLYLNQFMELNLIKQVSRYSYCATDWTNITPKMVIAVEAKLSKWQEALTQAVDNLNFADFSYVALDEDYCKQKIIQSFIQSNIGLISVSVTGSIQIIYEPKRNKQFISSDFNLQRIRICRDLICQNSKWTKVDFDIYHSEVNNAKTI